MYEDNDKGKDDSEVQVEEEAAEEYDEMVNALMSLGIKEKVSKWISGVCKEDTKEILKNSWKEIRMYGKGAQQIKQHVSELYSPPRVTAMAEKMGMIPGFALDLTVRDPEDGMPWDFDDPKKREKAEKMVKGKSSLLIVVSPIVGYNNSTTRRWTQTR